MFAYNSFDYFQFIIDLHLKYAKIKDFPAKLLPDNFLSFVMTSKASHFYCLLFLFFACQPNAHSLKTKIV